MTDEPDTSIMVKLGENLAMPLPPPDLRSAYNVGEHRLVQVWLDESDELHWRCFDHDDCWVATAVQSHVTTYGEPTS